MKKIDNLILFIYIDSLDFNRLGLLRGKTSFFRSIDVTIPLQNIPGYSFGIQSTLLTGKLPQEHKHWLPYIYLEGEQKEKKGDTKRIRRTLLPLKHLFPLKLRFESKVIEFLFTQSNNILNRFATGKRALLSSMPIEWREKIHVYPYYYMNELPFFKMFANEMKNRGCHICYMGHSLNNCIRKFASTISDFYEKSHEKALLFLYIDDLDGIGHKHGVFTDKYSNMLLLIDFFLSKLFKTCKNISKDLTFLIFSDHGMCNTADKVNLIGMLKHFVSYIDLAVIDATMAFIWLKDELRTSDIIAALKLQLRNQAIIFTPMFNKRELEKYGIYFKSREYGDIIIQLRPCKTFYPNFYSSLQWLKGLHGFWPTEEVQRSFLVVRSSATYDELLHFIRSVTDIRNLLHKLVQ